MTAPTMSLETQTDAVPDHAVASQTVADQTALWNFDEPIATQSAWTQPVMTHDVHLAETSKGATIRLSHVLLIPIIVCFGWFGWCFLSYGEHPNQSIDRFVALFSDDEVTSVVEQPQPVREIQARPATQQKSVAPALPYPSAGMTAVNPYESLTNALAAPTLPLVDMDGAEAFARWQQSMQGSYYQRYRVAEQVIAARAQGSEELLRQALQTGKFWLRMHALMALSDFGYSVSQDDIQTALQPSHSALRANFIKRFEASRPCAVGCQYVLRALMAHLDVRGKVAVLQVLGHHISPINAQYFVAATFDEDDSVRTAARSWLLKHPVGEREWWDTYRQIFAPTVQTAQVDLSKP